MSKLTEAQKQSQIDQGAWMFFSRHRDVAPLDANVAILSAEILLKNLPLDDIASWEAAFEAVGSKLAAPVKEVPAPEPAPSPWRYPFPEIHTVADVNRMDPKMYRDFWFDSSHGKLTQKALDFRRIVGEILDQANAQRKRRAQ